MLVILKIVNISSLRHLEMCEFDYKFKDCVFKNSDNDNKMNLGSAFPLIKGPLVVVAPLRLHS